SKTGRVLPEGMEVIQLVTKHQLTLESGHSSGADGLLIVHAARQAGVQHVVVTHAMSDPISMTIPQMQQAAREGAYIEFVCGATIPPNNGTPARLKMSDYAIAIRAVGPPSCILS